MSKSAATICKKVNKDVKSQAMTLARALWALKDDLQYYGNARGKPGFAQKLLEAIVEVFGITLIPRERDQWLGEIEQWHKESLNG